MILSKTGEAIHRQTAEQIVDRILAYPVETKIVVLARLIQTQVGEFRDVLEKLKREGFVRARVDGEIVELDRAEPLRLKKNERHTIDAVVDRLVVREGIRVRLADSVETALKWGGNTLSILRPKRKTPNAESDDWSEERFSTDYGNPETGFTLGQLTPKHFSFNSHLGACPACHGLGTQLVCDAELMSDPEKSLKELSPGRTIQSFKRVSKQLEKDVLG